MRRQAKITIVITAIVDLDTENYPENYEAFGGKTPTAEMMLKEELAFAGEDRSHYLEFNNTTQEISGEIIP